MLSCTSLHHSCCVCAASVLLACEVHRVRQMSIWLSRCPSLPCEPNMIVLELCALFHDMADAKYDASASARTLLLPFLSQYPQVLDEAQIELVIRIVENVSWSKDEARRAESERRRMQGLHETGEESEQQQWAAGCAELACVSDADRLDAIGSIGERCVPLFAARARSLQRSTAFSVPLMFAPSATSRYPQSGSFLCRQRQTSTHTAREPRRRQRSSRRTRRGLQCFRHCSFPRQVS